MDKKEIMKQAVDQIDPKYIEEAVTQEKASQKGLKLLTVRKTWIAAAAILLLLVTGGAAMVISSSDVFHVNKGDAEGSFAPKEDYSLNVPEANMAYNHILSIVSHEEEIDTSSDSYPYSYHAADQKYYDTVYEPWYGGAYTNVHGQLVVCLADSAGKEAMEKGQKVLSSYVSLFREVPYSYNELRACQKDIYYYLTSEAFSSETFRVFTWGLRDDANTVLVGLNSLDEKDLEKLRQHVRIPDALSFQYVTAGPTFTD